MSAPINTPRIPKKSDEMESNVSDLQTENMNATLERCAQLPTDRGLVDSSINQTSLGRTYLVAKEAIPTTPSDPEEDTLGDLGQPGPVHGEKPNLSPAWFPPQRFGKLGSASSSFSVNPLASMSQMTLDKIMKPVPERSLSRGSTDDTTIHSFQRWQLLRTASSRFGQSPKNGRHPGQLITDDSGQQSLEQEGPEDDVPVESCEANDLRDDDGSRVSHFDRLQSDLHLLDEKMDIMIDIMFKTMKYSKATYMSSKKSLTGPGHETGAVARVRFDAPEGNRYCSTQARASDQPELPNVRDRVAFRVSESGDQRINNMLELTRIITMQQDDKSIWKHAGSFIWRCMEDRTSSKTAAGYFIGINCFLLFSIAFAITDVVTESSNGSTCERDGFAMALALTIEICFTLEIGLRFLVCPARTLFWCNVFNIIDALSALPIGIRLLVFLVKPSCDVVYAMMCVVPVLRLMKLLRRFETFHLLASAFRTSAEALPAILFTLMLVTLFFAAIITYCEPRSNIPGYPAAVWYVFITMVGLAPAFPVPVTVSGKSWTAVLMLCGTLYMAIPIGIVGVAFSQVWEERQRLLILQRMRSSVERAGYSPKDMQTMFSVLDEDKDGMLDFEEFVSMLEVMQIEVQEQFALQVFESFDSDCEGSIDFKELIQGLFPHAHWLLSQEAPMPGEDALRSSGSMDSMPCEDAGPGIVAKSSVQTRKDPRRHTSKGRPKRHSGSNRT